MLKLYKTTDNWLNYWETWENADKTALIHWGVVGERGQVKVVKSGLFSDSASKVRKEVEKKISEGFAEFVEDKIVFLEVEYKIEGSGTAQDLEKRHRLEQYLDELLGWTGLGHVEGGSTGGGTMEAACKVVDFDTARKVLEDNLKDSEFGDYSGIYRRDND